MIRPGLLLGFVFCHALSGCRTAEPPAYRETIVLEGDAYKRGFQHGEQLSNKIKSFYTTMLTTSLFPYLSREQPGIAAFLKEYEKPRYQEGQFAFEVLLESARRQELSIPRALREEMRGIADGSGMRYEEILILNTFVDTVMSVRSVAAALAQARAPVLEQVEILGGIDQDDQDNDNDGLVDESGEAVLSYSPSPIAALVELPPNSRFRFVLTDPEGVDPATIRLQLNDKVFDASSANIVSQALPQDATRLEVVFTPDVPLPEAQSISLVLSAGDRSLTEVPAPARAQFMRDERLTFGVKGLKKNRFDVFNRGFADGRSQPPAWALALRGTATQNRKPLLAASFALLDANTSHKHTALFIHRPVNAKPFVVVGWAGLTWGFSGLNQDGLGLGCTYSDSLDNSVVKNLFEQIADLNNARLITSGAPIGVGVRQVLEKASSVDSATSEMAALSHTFGWNCLFADASGGLKAMEMDTNISGDGLFSYGPELGSPENVDDRGRPFASVGADDLRIASHFSRNQEDMYTLNIAGQRIAPQRFWSSYYYKSLRVFQTLGERISAGYGNFDRNSAIELLRETDLNDQRDGMNAVIIEPSTRTVSTAMGQIPPARGEFVVLEKLGDTP